MTDTRGQLLSIFRGHGEPDRDPEPPEEPGEPEPTLPVPPAQEMTRQEQAGELLRSGLRAARFRARELRKREGGLLHAARTYKAPSLDEQAAYAQNRAWVPRGHEGGAIDRSGTLYHKLIAGPVLWALLAGIWLTVRPLRLAIAFTAAWLLAAIGAWILGAHAIAIVMLAIHPGLAVLGLLILKAGQPAPEEED